MRREMLDKLFSWKADRSRKPLILKGVRQAGKTYLLKEFAGSVFPKFHYLNFESDSKLSDIFEAI
ncbi:MAG: AAA family ATPase [Deltaproteobacteria bacterium]|nr:AAA family ATPase [Deltaproteobacteria bacterium]